MQPRKDSHGYPVNVSKVWNPAYDSKDKDHSDARGYRRVYENSAEAKLRG